MTNNTLLPLLPVRQLQLHMFPRILLVQQFMRNRQSGRAASPPDADAAVAKERDWQYRHLVELRERSDSGK